ncbi:helix-turn-helix transcriptional regulator [Actinoplanes sp. CA-142083]|uniref:helix-turn-helix transcriptional regulator n=1 Tax=Actinoplanes sp. CA-142083 TaxID=3239903 RepID=UPI003D8FD810
MARAELARFLRDRRERLSPADAGLPGDGLRRTPGLRREEVAALAHMSVDYVVRLEQGRGPYPSPRILEGLSTALRLDPAQRNHLFRLAGRPPAPADGPSRRVRPHIAAMLGRVEEAAIVTDATYDVIAWNPLAERLLGGFRPTRNLARRRFLEGVPFETSGAEEFGAIAVSRLRAAARRYPRDERLAGLIADLRRSDEFGSLWASDPVRQPGHRSKTIDHPVAGRLRVNCDVLAVPDDDQQVVFVTADAGSRSARALRALAG